MYADSWELLERLQMIKGQMSYGFKEISCDDAM